MKDLKYNNNVNYRINIDTDEDNFEKEKNNVRINTENNIKYNNSNPFYKNKNKNNGSNYYLRTNHNNHESERDINLMIDNLINTYKKGKKKTPLYNKTSYNMNYNKKHNKLNKLFLTNNKEIDFEDNNNNKENCNYNNFNKNNKNYYYNYNNIINLKKYNNINKFGDEFEDIKIKNSNLYDFSYTKSILSDYIEEDNFNFN